MRFSIIVPLYSNIERFSEDLKRYEQLDYDNYEIIVVCDKDLDFQTDLHRVRVISTHLKQTGPAEKRDIALRFATGEICAFIDDDAYPDKQWLSKARLRFVDKNIGAVGGPGLTPPEDDFWQKAGGCVYESLLTSGAALKRFLRRSSCDIDDWPAYNLLVRTEILKSIGGFNSTFYGGEDTKVCLEIAKTGNRLIYAPEVIVFHHRRRLFREHLRQIANVGLHRGYFVKAYPETSQRPIYFLPLLVTEYFALLSIYAFFSLRNFWTLIYALCAYYALAFIMINPKRNIMLRTVAALGTICTHLVYGWNFLKGLFSKEIVR